MTSALHLIPLTTTFIRDDCRTKKISGLFGWGTFALEEARKESLILQWPILVLEVGEVGIISSEVWVVSLDLWEFPYKPVGC